MALTILNTGQLELTLHLAGKVETETVTEIRITKWRTFMCFTLNATANEFHSTRAEPSPCEKRSKLSPSAASLSSFRGVDTWVYLFFIIKLIMDERATIAST